MAESTGELVVLHDRRDRLEANRLVRKLESKGYRVALKDSPLGWRRVKADAPTVVLWSHHSGARNLRSALENDSAVIAKLDGRAAPAGANVTDLRGWRGQERHQGWKTLLEAVGPVTAPAAATPTVAPAKAKLVAKTIAPAAELAAPKKKSKAGAVMIGIVAALAVAAIGWAVVLFVL